MRPRRNEPGRPRELDRTGRRRMSDFLLALMAAAGSVALVVYLAAAWAGHL